MKRLLSYIFLFCILTACQEKQELPQMDSEPVLTRVQINLAAQDGFTSKSNTPQIPDVENLIHDVWLIQFSERGVRYTGIDKFYRTSGVDGARFLTLEAEIMSGKSTVCLIANLNKVNTDQTTFFNIQELQSSLPDNLPQFKTTLLDMGKLLHYLNTNYTLRAIPMFGYWEGNLDPANPTLGAHNLNVSLGRMVCRVNLTIDNKTSSTIKKVKFTNASNKGYYFPQISSTVLPSDSYCTDVNANTFELGVQSGHSATIYFYWGPNFCYGPEQATQMTFTDENGKTYSTLLTNSAPTDSNIDYNLYYNCNYSVTATLE